ncbi:MAG: tRNA pseudouridine(55) synthase TruB [Thioalkalivibrionaceae bacterium]
MASGRKHVNRRDVNGIVLLDKPQGLSATQALGRVKWLYGARKGGHTGALDPLATGLLPLCFGHATKVSGLLLDADKVYECVARLGVITDSADLDGAVLETRAVPDLNAASVEAAVAQFRGAIQQVPPMVSALKHKGQRLYALARKGVVVEREPRAVSIYSLEFRCLDETRLWLRVHCSKGTYIRSLVHDLGEVLGCGAAVEMLRRTRHGPFSIADAHTIEDMEVRFADAVGTPASADDASSGSVVDGAEICSISAVQAGREALDAWLLSPDLALAHLPEIDLDAARARFYCSGNPVFVAKPGDLGARRVYAKGVFLGVGEIIDDGRLAPRRRFVDAE